MNEIPEPWRTAAEQAGIRQTLRGIAEAADISHVTLRRLIVEGRTSPRTVGAVAEALGVSRATVYEWAGHEPDLELWEPPFEAHKLSPRAKAALTELILAITQEGETDVSTTEAPEKITERVSPAAWLLEEAAIKRRRPPARK